MSDLGTGNLARAEILCREILDIQPDNPDALNILGVISLKIGMPDFADRFFRDAAESALSASLPVDHAALKKNLTSLTMQGSVPGISTQERFILIKAWGFGFWSDVDHVLGALLLAEITGRLPIVHWGANSLFSDDPGVNAFETFFEPVSSLTIDDLTRNDLDYFPPKWSAQNLRHEDVAKWRGGYSRMGALYFLRRAEAVIVCDFHISIVGLAPWIPQGHPLYGLSVDGLYGYLVKKYLKPKNTVLAQVDEFYNLHLAGTPYIAAHVRGSDKQLELSHLDRVNAEYVDRIATLLSNPSWKIFMMSDSVTVVADFQSRFGNRLITTACQRTSDHVGIHYKSNADGKARLGIEVLVDTYLAARATCFIGNGASNVSCIIKYLKDWKKNEYTLLVPSMYHARNPYLYG